MTKSPCKNCEDRHDWCHSECDRYKAFKAECDRVKDIKNRVSQTMIDCNEVTAPGKQWRKMR